MRRVFVLTILLSILLGTHGFAADKKSDDIRVKAEIDKAFLTVGDRLTYTVTVEHAPDIKVLSSVPSPASDVLEIKKIEDISRKENRKIVEGRKFILTTYRLGEFILDPVTIQYRKEGQEIKSLQTNKLYLTVKSIAGGKTQEDIRDIKPVVPLGFHPGKWGVVLLALAVFAAGFGIYQRFFRKKGPSGPAPSPLTPEQEALLHLTELFESDLLKRGQIKPYYLRLSEILRVYFEKRYQVLAVELTTVETLRALRPLHIDPVLYQKIQHVLEAADLAKFAKWVPTASDVIQINKKSEEIVKEAAPLSVPSVTEVPHGV